MEKRLTHKEDFSHLFEYAMRDMSPYAFEGNSTFSLENIKQEYSDFRLRRYAFSGI